MFEHSVRERIEVAPLLETLRFRRKGELVSRRKPIARGDAEAIAKYAELWIETYLQLAKVQLALMPDWVVVKDQYVSIDSIDYELLIMDVLTVQYSAEQESRMHCFLTAYRVTESEFQLGGESIEDLIKAFLKERKCFERMKPW